MSPRKRKGRRRVLPEGVRRKTNLELIESIRGDLNLLDLEDCDAIDEVKARALELVELDRMIVEERIFAEGPMRKSHQIASACGVYERQVQAAERRMAKRVLGILRARRPKEGRS